MKMAGRDGIRKRRQVNIKGFDLKYFTVSQKLLQVFTSNFVGHHARAVIGNVGSFHSGSVSHIKFTRATVQPLLHS
jgi:hypothetical protein